VNLIDVSMQTLSPRGKSFCSLLSHLAVSPDLIPFCTSLILNFFVPKPPPPISLGHNTVVFFTIFHLSFSLFGRFLPV